MPQADVPDLKVISGSLAQVRAGRKNLGTARRSPGIKVEEQ
jgi:hypothetical protein